MGVSKLEELAKAYQDAYRNEASIDIRLKQLEAQKESIESEIGRLERAKCGHGDGFFNNLAAKAKKALIDHLRETA